MVFSTAVFIFVFLPIVFLLNSLLGKKCSNYVLIIASIIFYAWGAPDYAFVMIGSIVINWGIGIGIGKAKEAEKKWFLLLGISVDLGILVYFKYIAFFASVLNQVMGKEIFTISGNVELPIGLSFFTFQAISYLVDVYRGEVEYSKKIENVALYISFFPQLIAGPIVKYHDINRQIENRKVTFDGIAVGFRRFIYGLGKKVLIANVLGLCADTIYSWDVSTIDCRTAWIGALAYTFQIYYDFSGYSDMAIGLGKIFGFDIQENFSYPYCAYSISDFWRKWHISLGTWFREYVYIPLGGNRKGVTRTYINLFIIFFLTGLWHGANYTFVVWGLYHGFWRIIERLGMEKHLEKHKVLATIYTFIVVNFGWVFFRSNSLTFAIHYLANMVNPFGNVESIPLYRYLDMKTLGAAALAVLGMGIMKKILPDKIVTWWKYSWAEAVFNIFVLVLCVTAIASNTYNPFIYFQF